MVKHPSLLWVFYYYGLHNVCDGVLSGTCLLPGAFLSTQNVSHLERTFGFFLILLPVKRLCVFFVCICGFFFISTEYGNSNICVVYVFVYQLRELLIENPRKLLEIVCVRVGE